MLAFLQNRGGSIAETVGVYAADKAPGERTVRYIANEEFEKIAPKIFADNREWLRRLVQ